MAKTSLGFIFLFCSSSECFLTKHPLFSWFRKKAGTAVRAGLDDMAGSTNPIKSFDPLGLATVGSDETLAWFRAAELKHSRVAMVAFVGFLVQGQGLHFPGQLSSDVSFESVSKMGIFEAWDAVPSLGKAQILATILIAEIATEAKPVHYTKGGPLPTIVFPPIDMSPGVTDVKLNRELNNGRLAMIGIMSVISASAVPGSVPALKGLDIF
mmetsp:Transcript_32731/g.75360  ORF Transcript_32731/g.75360 Transcript_32731/m.75360 type:complete len:211 (+) Transcript_32731:412-1044(+)